MTSWVLTIDRDHPGHWTIAKEHGFWDMVQHRAIQQGDLVYFWQAGESFVAKTRATSAPAPMPEGAQASWEDSGDRQYSWRFHFVVLSESTNAQPRWEKDVGARLRPPYPRLNSKPMIDHPQDEAVLDSYFNTPLEESVERLLSQEEGVEDTGYPDPLPTVDQMSQDDTKVVRAIRRYREGQDAFRDELIRAYGCCAVTGTQETAALEGAHIIPYRGRHSNIVPNGLPLRRDIHGLFDRHLLTIDVNGVVRVSPAVDEALYRDLDGKALRQPLRARDRPHPDYLEVQRNDCRAWFSDGVS